MTDQVEVLKTALVKLQDLHGFETVRLSVETVRAMLELLIQGHEEPLELTEEVEDEPVLETE